MLCTCGELSLVTCCKMMQCIHGAKSFELGRCSAGPVELRWRSFHPSGFQSAGGQISLLIWQFLVFSKRRRWAPKGLHGNSPCAFFLLILMLFSVPQWSAMGLERLLHGNFRPFQFFCKIVLPIIYEARTQTRTRNPTHASRDIFPKKASKKMPTFEARSVGNPTCQAPDLLWMRPGLKVLEKYDARVLTIQEPKIIETTMFAHIRLSWGVFETTMFEFLEFLSTEKCCFSFSWIYSPRRMVFIVRMWNPASAVWCVFSLFISEEAT